MTVQLAAMLRLDGTPKSLYRRRQTTVFREVNASRKAVVCTRKEF